MICDNGPVCKENGSGKASRTPQQYNVLRVREPSTVLINRVLWYATPGLLTRRTVPDELLARHTYLASFRQQASKFTKSETSVSPKHHPPNTNNPGPGPAKTLRGKIEPKIANFSTDTDFPSRANGRKLNEGPKPMMSQALLPKYPGVHSDINDSR